MVALAHILAPSPTARPLRREAARRRLDRLRGVLWACLAITCVFLFFVLLDIVVQGARRGST